LGPGRRAVPRGRAAEQDHIARLVLDQIEDEARSQATLAGSQAKLAELAAAAREEIARGDVPSNRRE
jgi:hypothetical protein